MCTLLCRNKTSAVLFSRLFSGPFSPLFSFSHAFLMLFSLSLSFYTIVPPAQLALRNRKGKLGRTVFCRCHIIAISGAGGSSRGGAASAVAYCR